ncbi:MAG: LysM peptidoglycan-binding domain-containing protein [Chlamydiae bacterium]|nr:LysM peptidoglycan-binding domain-containing protein [Chlamydiota bacterium]
MYRMGILAILIIMSSCTSQLAMVQKDRYDTSVAIDEMRIELSDMKYALNNTQVEIQILEEKIRAQEASNKNGKVQSTSSAPHSEIKLSLLEKKINQLENSQEKLTADLKQLSTHANQTSQSFSQYYNRIKELESEINAHNKAINELSDLKTTLKSLTQAIKNKPNSSSISTSTNVYKVKPGDNLEKIAKAHKTTVDAIQKENNISSHKIVVGQEIKIPNG